MSDYITRDSAKGAVSAMLGLENLHTGSIIFAAIDLIPAADVEEVRHGEWVWHKNITEDGYVWSKWECSACGYVRTRGWEYTSEGSKPRAKICEHCGAKMDGGNDERRREAEKEVRNDETT